jgi:hypothetical protein
VISGWTYSAIYSSEKAVKSGAENLSSKEAMPKFPFRSNNPVLTLQLATRVFNTTL